MSPSFSVFRFLLSLFLNSAKALAQGFYPGCTSEAFVALIEAPTHGDSDSTSLRAMHGCFWAIAMSLAFLNHLQFPQWATSSHTYCSLPEWPPSTAPPSSLIPDSAEMVPPGSQFFLVLVILPGYLVCFPPSLDVLHCVCLFPCHFPLLN